MAFRSPRLYSVAGGMSGNDVQMAALATGAQPRDRIEPSYDVSEEFVRDTLTHLRSVLLSSREGLTPKQILYDYIYFVGEPVPYLQMGYSDFVSFLDANSDVCERTVENGRVVYLPKINEKCQHIWRLVNCQRSPTRRLRPRKRKSISTNEAQAPPKRPKSAPRRGDGAAACDQVDVQAESVAAPSVDIAVHSSGASTPPEAKKSVHDNLIAEAARQRPRRQRSRTRLPFFHRDDPSKPKLKTPRRRGRSMSTLPASADGALQDPVRGKTVVLGKTTVSGTKTTTCEGGNDASRGNTITGNLAVPDVQTTNTPKTKDATGNDADPSCEEPPPSLPDGQTRADVGAPTGSHDQTVLYDQACNNDQTPTNNQNPAMELSSSNDRTPVNEHTVSDSDPTTTSSDLTATTNSQDTIKWKVPFKRRRFYPGRTSTPRRPITDYPVPEDIRKNLIRTLETVPKGAFVHEIPDLYEAKVKRRLPQFLSSTAALIEIFACLTADVRMIKHECGSVTVKLHQFDKPKASVTPIASGAIVSSVPKNLKSHVVETLLRILSRRNSRGVFLSRLRVEFFKETGEMIPVKRLGFVSERQFFASMPENFNLRPSTSVPGVEPEYIVSVVTANSD